MMTRPTLRTTLPGPNARAVIARSEGAVSSSYTRDYPLVAERALGCWITDPDDNVFLDMNAGIAVTSTGHCHPHVVDAVRTQAGKLLHMSGTDFYYPVQAMLASRLTKLGAVRGENHQVYFGNSGAEANEAAIKLVRYHTGRHAIIAFMGSFHGRTMGALSLTSSKVDEVQSGMGRTGKMFAWQHDGVAPDVISLAKGIASGLPLCAVMASDSVMHWLPGSHASTFGGNPVACAAANATLDLLEGSVGDMSLVENSAAVGARFQAMLREAVGAHARVCDVRGRGLMIGVELVKSRDTMERDPDLRNRVVNSAFEKGMLIIGCGPNTVRFCPALVVNDDECRVATEIFADVLNAESRLG